jgi:hypothetical protein
MGTALAGSNSYSIMVSCTIPAIPGVNVPLVVEESVVSRNQVATTNLEEQKAPEKEDQIEKEQTLPSAQEGTLVLTKTIYSR